MTLRCKELAAVEFSKRRHVGMSDSESCYSLAESVAKMYGSLLEAVP